VSAQIRYPKGKIPIRSYAVNSIDCRASRIGAVVVVAVGRWMCKYENIVDDDRQKTGPLRDITAAF